MTQTLEREYRLVDFETLTQDTKRYLADLLIGYLREDRWELRVDPEYSPVQPNGETPNWKTIGGGRGDPLESSHVMSFVAPPLHGPDIAKHLVMLEATAFEQWERYHLGEAVLLERLTVPMHGAKRVFFPELSGYGTNKKLKMRRSKWVTKEEGEAAISVLGICIVAKLG